MGRAELQGLNQCILIALHNNSSITNLAFETLENGFNSRYRPGGYGVIWHYGLAFKKRHNFREQKVYSMWLMPKEAHWVDRPIDEVSVREGWFDFEIKGHGRINHL